jgi:hypothetical protein
LFGHKAQDESGEYGSAADVLDVYVVRENDLAALAMLTSFLTVWRMKRTFSMDDLFEDFRAQKFEISRPSTRLGFCANLRISPLRGCGA